MVIGGRGVYYMGMCKKQRKRLGRARRITMPNAPQIEITSCKIL